MLGEKVAHVNLSPHLCIPGFSAKSETPSSVYSMLGEKVAPVNVTPHLYIHYYTRAVLHATKLQALVYDILPSTTAVFSYAIGSRKLSAKARS